MYIIRDCQQFSCAYLDDVAVFSKNWEEHCAHLRQVFSRLHIAGLTLKLRKCRFGGIQVPYLGHIIGGGIIQPDPSKVQAVREFPRPVTKTDIRAFLGLVGYYHQFIPGCATIAAPLTDLTRKGQSNQVNWGDDQEAAFQ